MSSRILQQINARYAKPAFSSTTFKIAEREEPKEPISMFRTSQPLPKKTNTTKVSPPLIMRLAAKAPLKKELVRQADKITFMSTPNTQQNLTNSRIINNTSRTIIPRYTISMSGDNPQQAPRYKTPRQKETNLLITRALRNSQTSFLSVQVRSSEQSRFKSSGGLGSVTSKRQRPQMQKV